MVYNTILSIAGILLLGVTVTRWPWYGKLFLGFGPFSSSIAFRFYKHGHISTLSTIESLLYDRFFNPMIISRDLQNISESAASEKKRSYEYDPVTPRFWFVLQLVCTRSDHVITFSYTLTPPSRHINPYSYRIGP